MGQEVEHWQGSWRPQPGSSSPTNRSRDLECCYIFLAICKIRGLTYKTSEVLFFGSTSPRRAAKMGRTSTFQDLLHTYLKSSHVLNFNYGNTPKGRIE